MRTETKMLVWLLLLPPLFGEVLNGNFPPLRLLGCYGVPAIAFVLLYGCGTLLMHELRARWKLQWSLVLLAVAYAIIEEGFATKAFLDPGHGGPKSLFSYYGFFFGVKWVWALGVGYYHATLSTLAPLFVLTLLWPHLTYTPLLKKKGMILTLLGFGLITFGGFCGSGKNPETGEVFFPSAGLGFTMLAVVISLIALASAFRKSRIQTDYRLLPPWVFGLVAAGVQTFFLFNYLFARAKVNPVITILIQLLVIAFSLFFMRWQILNRGATVRHHVALIVGAAAVYIAITPLHEFLMFTGKGRGMLAVGILGAWLLYKWRKVVLSREAAQAQSA